ncbi:hypothetical protein PACTADRAFT_76294 [Pachysolen tannophilus NRRL Y-2460]|uniref:PH domain-containing protein n=1 Tax=Pachysolen tannophilus NRRL Y-2460 TaxID=669874 RepID=A0A1E4TSD8_PACTA|nr:hypothetical protein PACTADRAFT_76294 [Pachysolen tannophilus NRRL Y-2460]
MEGETGQGNEARSLVDSIPVDSSSILAQRYDKWLLTIQNLQNFIESYLSIIGNNIKGYEKLNKQLVSHNIPQFDQDASNTSLPVNGSSAATLSEGGGASGGIIASDNGNGNGKGQNGGSAPVTPVTGSSSYGINDWYELIKGNMKDNLDKFQEVENMIRVNVLPEFKKLIEDVQNRKKTLINESAKELKEIKKFNAVTAKEIKKLGNATMLYDSAYNTLNSKVDIKNDPYIINRLILYYGDLQIAKENMYIEFIKNNELNFKIFEDQIFQFIKKIFNNLNTYNQDLFQQEMLSFNNLNNALINIPNDYEWNNFSEKNGKNLITSPRNDENSLKKTLSSIIYQNEHHSSIDPILDGLLSRKEAKFIKKTQSTYYYVITKTRYFLEFSSRSFKDSPNPSLIFYLPNCFIKQRNPKDEQDFRFELVGKDMSNLININKKNLVLTASNEEEMLTWYNVISEASGLMQDNEEVKLEEQMNSVNLNDSYSTDISGNASPNPEEAINDNRI